MAGGCSVESLVPRSFYSRDALVVARELLGMVLCRGEVGLRITETEAYRWPDDSANHCRMGRTARNTPMWGPAGHAYIYLCYGIHHMLNLVTGREGDGEAVLIRAAEPARGLRIVRSRRRGLSGPGLLTGPGKVGAALGLDLGFNHHALYQAGGLELRQGTPVGQVLVGPRVGIAYARPEHRDAPWRFAVAGTPWVSHRRALRLDGRTP